MIHKPICDDLAVTSRDRLEVRTLRCGRNNPGSNPGHGTFFLFIFFILIIFICCAASCKFTCMAFLM